MSGPQRTVHEVLASHRDTIAPNDLLDLNPLPPTVLHGLDGSGQTPRLTKQAWREVQFRLSKAAAPATGVPSDRAADEIAAGHRRAGLVPITIGHYRYRRPRAGITADAAAADPAAAVEERTAFYAATLAHQDRDVLIARPAKHRGLRVRYVVPSDLVLGNLGALPGSVAIDFGDGRGERAVTLDQPITVDYESPRTAHMRLTAQVGAVTLHAAFELEIAMASSVPPVSEQWEGIQGGWSYNGVTTTGHAWVFYGAGNNAITNPILIAEGFPGGYSLEALWDILDTQGLASSLLASGNDLVICGFDEGTSYIEANAGVIGTIIANVLTQRQGNAPLIVGGASMGGLVTRYALTYMQSLGLDPQTALYFSFDSPHYGATVPLSVAWFAEVFSGVSSAAQQAMEMLQSIAAQELLMISLVDGTVSSPSMLREDFMGNLGNAGWYPKDCTLVGVSNGDITGGNNGTPGGAEILTLEKDLNAINGQLYSAPGVTTQDSLIYHSRLGFNVTTESFPTFYAGQPGPELDSAPGGYGAFFLNIYDALTNYNPTIVADNATFIPIASALAMGGISLYAQQNLFIDLQTNPQGSDLDAYYADTSNNPHVTVTPGIANFMQIVVASVRDPAKPSLRNPAQASARERTRPAARAATSAKSG